jgi:hypothetical protein
MWCLRFTERIIRIIIKAKGNKSKLKIKFTKKLPFTRKTKEEKSPVEKIPKSVGINGMPKRIVAKINKKVFLKPCDI